MENNFLNLAKEISNSTEGSIEEALTLLHNMTEKATYKKYDFDFEKCSKEKRSIHAFIDYFIETKGLVKLDEIGENIINQLPRADETKLKAMMKVFHDIEDNKLKISILKKFNNLIIFKKEDTKDYISYLNGNSTPIPAWLNWNYCLQYTNYIIRYKFAKNRNFDCNPETLKILRNATLCYYKYVFENFPYLLTEFKLNSVIASKATKFGISKERLITKFLQDEVVFELIKYKKKYYDSIKKKYPVSEGKVIYVANQYNQKANKKEIDDFLEETFGIDKLRTLVKKATTNKEI